MPMFANKEVDMKSVYLRMSKCCYSAHAIGISILLYVMQHI